MKSQEPREIGTEEERKKKGQEGIAKEKGKRDSPINYNLFANKYST